MTSPTASAKVTAAKDPPKDTKLTGPLSSNGSSACLTEGRAGLDTLVPLISQPQKVEALRTLRAHFTKPDVRLRYAEVVRGAGSHFQLQDLQKELVKPVQMLDFCIQELLDGKHRYAQADSVGLSVRPVLGRILGMSAPNYPIGENAAFLAVLNAVLAGTPMDIRLGAQSTGAIDEIMAKDVIELLAPILGEGFIESAHMIRATTDEVLKNYAAIYFIGGPVGQSLAQRDQFPEAGNIQTGRPNFMVVSRGMETEAVRILGNAAASRFGLSCSASSIIFTEDDGQALAKGLLERGEAIKGDLIGAGHEWRADPRFYDAMLEAVGVYAKSGGVVVSEEDGYLSLVKIKIEEFARLQREAVTANTTVPEIFGPGFLIVTGTDFTSDLDSVPHAKTGIVVAPGEVAERLVLRLGGRVGRIAINTGSSTPPAGTAPFNHANTDGPENEREHSVAPAAFLGAPIYVQWLKPTEGWQRWMEAQTSLT